MSYEIMILPILNIGDILMETNKIKISFRLDQDLVRNLVIIVTDLVRLYDS